MRLDGTSLLGEYCSARHAFGTARRTGELNMWMDVDMRAHLSSSGQGEMWDRSIVPAMKAIAQQMIKCATDNAQQMSSALHV